MNKERFMRHVKKAENGCWLWKGATVNKGYGKCGDGYSTVLAHRMSYRLFVGTIPDKLQIRHKCAVRLCVNPEHLETGTGLENMQDAKDRGTRLGPNSKLSDARIIQVFALGREGKSDQFIADKFNMCRQSINYILAKKRQKARIEKLIAQGHITEGQTNAN